jgi:putative ABC transport system permease protein
MTSELGAAIAGEEHKGIGPGEYSRLGFRMALGVAWETISADVPRTFLVSSSIAVGVYLSVLVGSMTHGIDVAFTTDAGVLTADRFTVRGGRDQADAGPCIDCRRVRARQLSLGEVVALEALPEVRQVVAVERGLSTAKSGDVEFTDLPVLAAGRGWAAAQKADIIDGREFTGVEQRSGAPVILLNKRAARFFFADGKAIGSTIALQGHQFRIIGLYDMSLIASGVADPPGAVIPLLSARRQLGDPLNMLEFVIVPETDRSAAIDGVTGALREMHGLHPSSSSDFVVVDQDELRAAVADLTSTVSWALFAVGVLSLLIGGVGIGTSMSIAVRQRTVEIGTRKALGATTGAVLMHFLIEATLLSIVGGATGTILATLTYAAISGSFGLPVSGITLSLAAGAALAIVVAVLFGLQPSLRAARLRPIDALRGL